MRLHLLFVLILIAALGMAGPLPAPARAQGGTPQTVPNEYVMFYEPGTSQAEIDALVASSGGTLLRQIPELNAVVVYIPTRTGASTLSARPGVTYLEPNLLRQPTITPNDPGRASQWGPGKIGVYDAWDVTLGTGQVIAVLDTGVDLDHPDLAAHLLAGFDYVGLDSDPSPDPGAPNHVHGTHVAGIANAVTNNGTGIAGVAWDARTLPVRIISATGATSSNIALGIIYATDHGATVINLSLGGPGWVKVERDAVNYAADHGVIVVASAGNDETSTPDYPASYDHVISVASTTSSNNRSSFSNFGEYVDVAAPGSGIYSTLYNNTYGTMDGTSMAAPHVAGVAALVRSAGHATTLDAITEALLCSAQDLGASGWDQYLGWGLIQANAAVNYLPGTNACLPHVAHDQIENARLISLGFRSPAVYTSASYTDTVDISKATSWRDDPNPCAGASNRTVWYHFYAPAPGTLKMNTVGSTYDTVMAVYRGTIGALTSLGCNNDASGTTSALDVTVGRDSIYVMISSRLYEGGGGTLTFNATFEAQSLPGGCVPIGTESNTILCTSG